MCPVDGEGRGVWSEITAQERCLYYLLVCVYRSVNKRVTSLQFSEAADYLLTADKTGEVIRSSKASSCSLTMCPEVHKWSA